MCAASWFERIPKAELHLHLEGAIPHDALWELIRKYGGDDEVPDLDALRRRFAYRDFAHFLEVWTWKNGFLREYDDFTWVAEAVAGDLAAQNIRYVEAFYSPVDFSRHGLETQRLTEAIRTGLDRVPGTRVSLVADLVRNYGPERGARTLDEVSEVLGLGVVGIGIGGPERGFPPGPFRHVYATARERGLRTSAHAGEADGSESVWGAVRELEVDRIGHGTRAEEDPALLEHLAESGIHVEVCPLSNVRTGVVASLDEHPVRRYFERGIRISISTDDPKMFGNTLAEELELLETRLGFARDEIRALQLGAIDACWLPDAEKKELRETFSRDAAWDRP